jgi:hypothetical protein
MLMIVALLRRRLGSVGLATRGLSLGSLHHTVAELHVVAVGDEINVSIALSLLNEPRGPLKVCVLLGQRVTGIIGYINNESGGTEKQAMLLGES